MPIQPIHTAYPVQRLHSPYGVNAQQPYSGAYQGANGQMVRFRGVYDVGPMAHFGGTNGADQFVSHHQKQPQVMVLQAPGNPSSGRFRRFLGNALLFGAGLVLWRRMRHNYGNIFDFAKHVTGKTSHAARNLANGVSGGSQGAWPHLKAIFQPTVTHL